MAMRLTDLLRMFRLLFLLPLLFLAACSAPPPTATTQPDRPLAASETPALALTPTPSATRRAVHSATAAPSPSLTPSVSPTPQAASPSPTRVSRLAFSPWELVMDVAFSPDGRTLAVAAGQSVRLVDPETLAAWLALEAGSMVTSLAFSPDGAWLALATKDGSLQLWNLAAGSQVCCLAAHPRSANRVAFSPDGLRLASTGNDAVVRLWETAALSACSTEIDPLAVLIGGAIAVPDLAFSPDGQIIATVDLHAIRLRDPATQRLIRTLSTDASVFSLAFSPDGAWLASGESGGAARLWQAATGELAGELRVSDDPSVFVWRVAFDPLRGSLAVGASDGTLGVWNLPGLSLNRTFPPHRAPDGPRAVTSLAFSPDGRWLVSGGLDGAVQFHALNDPAAP